MFCFGRFSQSGYSDGPHTRLHGWWNTVHTVTMQCTKTVLLHCWLEINNFNQIKCDSKKELGHKKGANIRTMCNCKTGYWIFEFLAHTDIPGPYLFLPNCLWESDYWLLSNSLWQVTQRERKATNSPQNPSSLSLSLAPPPKFKTGT